MRGNDRRVKNFQKEKPPQAGENQKKEKILIISALQV
jgi:hypothetical protein